MDALRNRLRRWMIEAMAERKWSAERWGREASTAPTNITRFLKNDNAALPTTRTIEKLAYAIGIPAPIGDLRKIPLNTVSIVDPITVKMVHWPATTQDRERLMSTALGTLRAPHDVSAAAFAVEAPTGSLSGIGVMLGDVLVIEPDGEQVNGAKLLYKIADRLDIGVLEHGAIYPRSFNPSAPVRIGDVEIVGRIVSVVKKL